MIKRIALPFAFLVFLGLWTWKLLEPYPLPEAVQEEIGGDWQFYLAKCLHAGAYAFLTVLGCIAFPRWQWWVVGFLVLHGAGTEIGQHFLPPRHGCIRDALIDWAGIACGLLAFLWGSGQCSRWRNGALGA